MKGDALVALRNSAGTIWGAGKEYENAFIMDRNLGQSVRCIRLH